ncbi:hypothetical protein KBT16_23055 [Nostoc sp. CCCryo 231-06]|nr:hypothetical protein [Nostoc sp. CCCryo 231-06]
MRSNICLFKPNPALQIHLCSESNHSTPIVRQKPWLVSHKPEVGSGAGVI